MTNTWSLDRGAAHALLLVACAVTAPACTDDDDGDSVLTVANESSFVLTEVRIAEIDDPTWGPNLLPDVLFPGEEIVVVDIECGFYDVLVVDETGVECALFDVDLCFEDAVWVVDDLTLDTCAFAP